MKPNDLISILSIAGFSSCELCSHNDAFFALWEYEYTGKTILKQLVKYFVNLIVENIESLKEQKSI